MTHAAFDGHALLINSLVDFNFRRPLLLEFPGEQLLTRGRSLRQFSTC
jgi:hypothetical protein